VVGAFHHRTEHWHAKRAQSNVSSTIKALTAKRAKEEPRRSQRNPFLS
jgi:hypothetical protein